MLLSSLRFRLLMLMLLALVPALGLMLYTASGERAAAAQEAQADALRVARSAAADQAALIDQARLVLSDLAQVYAMNVSDVRLCNAIYSELRARYVQSIPRYANLGVIDPDGQVFCSVVPVSGPVDLSGRADFQLARQSPDFTIGEALVDQELNAAYIYLYYPVLSFGGSVRAVMFAMLDLSWLETLGLNAQLPEGSTLSVFDESGHVLMQYPAAPPAAKLAPIQPELLRAVRSPSGTGTAELDDGAGVPHLYAFSRLSGNTANGPGLYLAAGIPAETVYAHANQVLARNLVVLTVVAVLAIALSGFGSDWLLVRPVNDLVRATRRLAAGDLTARTGLRTSRNLGEIGQLASAFDQMADALERRDAARREVEAALRRSEELYRTLAHNFPNGAVILFDHDLRYILADGAGLPEVGLSRAALEGKTIYEIFSPELCAVLEPHYRQALAGQESSVEVEFSNRVFLVQSLPLRNEQGEMFAGMAVTRDITERKRAYQLLEKRVEERTRQLSTLLAVSREASFTLELDPLLERILDGLNSVVDYTAASVASLEGAMFHVRACRGPAPDGVVRGLRFEADLPLDRQVMESRKPLMIGDIRGDSPEARLFREGMEHSLDLHYPDLHTWMRVPLIFKDRVIGLVTLHHREPDRYTQAEADLALAFANQAAVVIENARLFSAERRRAEQFRVINEVGQHITSILAVDELLSQTVLLIRATFGYYHAHVGLIEDSRVVFRPSAGVWAAEPVCDRCGGFEFRVGRDGVSGWVAAHGEPLLVPDINRELRYIKVDPAQTGSALVLPLKVKGQVIGVLNVESERLNAFDESDIVVLQSLVNQLAIAIENARLYQQAGQLAALEERQKLARELHDSVSQALYGIALGARTARTLLDRDPVKAADPLDYVISLAQAGLAEMRALIFELRPESIKTEGLVAALTKQADSLRARHRLEVTTNLSAEPEVALETKEALYRISQEALHNIAKHARASKVALSLAPCDGTLLLDICDDGLGFDPQGEFPGHLGLKSMRERAERVGGRLAVESGAGRGTRIQVQIPL